MCRVHCFFPWSEEMPTGKEVQNGSKARPGNLISLFLQTPPLDAYRRMPHEVHLLNVRTTQQSVHAHPIILIGGVVERLQTELLSARGSTLGNAMNEPSSLLVRWCDHSRVLICLYVSDVQTQVVVRGQHARLAAVKKVLPCTRESTLAHVPNHLRSISCRRCK